MSYNFLDKTGLTHLWNKIKSYIIKKTIPLIEGTQASSTSAWTGVAPFSELTDGQVINYYLPLASTNTAVTLNLTLSDGTTTGALPVYYSNGTERMTTHFGRGSVITLIYRSNRVNSSGTAITNSWLHVADRDTTNVDMLRGDYYRPYIDRSIVTNNTLYRYQLCFGVDENHITPLNNNDNVTGTTKTMLTTQPFDPFLPITRYNSTTTVTTGIVPTSTLEFVRNNIDLRYTFNCGTTLTVNKNVYAVCTISNGKAYITSPYYTQTLPTTEDNKYYILLGISLSNYQIQLFPNHPIYYYKGSQLRIYSGDKIPSKTSDLTNDSGYTANTGTVTSVAVKMNGASKGTVTTSGTIDLGTVITAHQDISGKQDKLTAQTAYTAKGTSTKVPQITTNTLGQVTGITEVSITQPTVNNGTLTIQKNGTNVQTFTANQSSDVTANISVPTATSDLTNDSDFTTESALLSSSAFKQAIVELIYPVGSLYITDQDDDDHNPNNLFPGTTWYRTCIGRALTGALDSEYTGPINNNVNTFGALGWNAGWNSAFQNKSMGGQYVHALTVNEMPSHSHSTYIGGTNGSGYVGVNGTPVSTKAMNTATSSAGGGASHPVIQPYEAYMIWRRGA